jgi:hypothetical protein
MFVFNLDVKNAYAPVDYDQSCSKWNPKTAPSKMT